MRVWSSKDLRTFLTSVEDEHWFAHWRLAATTGMRRGELLGLCWRDVDLYRERVNIRRQLQGSGRTMRFAPPTTEAGRRCIALDRTTVEALRQHKYRHSVTWSPSQAQRLGDAELVFCRADGSGRHPTYFPMNLPACYRSPGCPRFAFTTFATLTPLSLCRPESIPRWSRSGSATPASRSPWTPTHTCFRPCTRRPRHASPRLSMWPEFARRDNSVTILVTKRGPWSPADQSRRDDSNTKRWLPLADALRNFVFEPSPDFLAMLHGLRVNRLPGFATL